MKAFWGVEGPAGGRLLLRLAAALQVGRVTVIGRQLGDVVRLRVRHLQVAADALGLGQRDVPEPLPDRHPRGQSQHGARQGPAPPGAAVLRLLPSRDGGHGGRARGRGQVLLAGQAEVAWFGLDVHLDLHVVGALSAERFIEIHTHTQTHTKLSVKTFS